MFLQETFVIEDCLKTYMQSYNSATTINYSLPSSFEIEFILNFSSNGDPSYAYLRFNSSSANLFAGKLSSSSRDIKLHNGSDHLLNQISMGTDTKYSLTYSNGSATLKNGSDTVTASMSLTKLYSLNPSSRCTIKNVKIKAL